MTNRIRSAAAPLLFLSCLVTLTSAFKLPNRSPDLPPRLASLSIAAKPAQKRTALTLADRVAYQRAIEEVYWRHRIWPKERPDPKPSLDEVMPSAQLERKVEDYLRNSEALEDYWKEPLSAEQLQAEMERMARHTKQPEVLRELFEALGNDPFVIAECLARPALSERLVTNLYAHDQRFHGELKQRAEADLRAHHTLREMKQTSGKYGEIQLVRSDSEEIVGQAPRLPNKQLAGGAPALQRQDSTTGTELTNREWDENVQKLAAAFDRLGAAKTSSFGVRSRQRGIAALQSADMSAHSENAAEESYQALPVGKPSSLQEDEGRYYATAVIRKGKDRLKLATVEWRKELLESWKARVGNQLPKVKAATSANYHLPAISEVSNGCIDNTWTATNDGPIARSGHTAVWTGSEMIIWGGTDGLHNLNTGGRYNPSTDSWTATSTTNAPSGRGSFTAVWTGSEMIIWGGVSSSDLNTGGRYNPSTDSWTATSTANAPSARESHTAVWTGSEMIVWGGSFLDNAGYHYVNTGARYDPTTDSWTATTTTNAPTARSGHTVVWTGSEMIIWGGEEYPTEFNTGGRYNPGTDSWTATSTTNAPTARSGHTAVWTGSEMIIWGGFDSSYSNTGGRYNPSADSWIATSTANAPTARDGHTAVWTGTEMIVWGGICWR